MDSHAPPPEGGSPTRPRPGKRAKLIGAVIALLVLAGLGWLAWDLTHPDAPAGASGAPGAPGGAGAGARAGGGGPGGGGRRGAPATTVGIAVAEKADIPVALDALGTVVPSSVAIVRPQVSGVLLKIHFTEGQAVKAGQLLAEIDPRQFEMALLQASGQRLRDEAQLEAAKITLGRFQKLLELDSIARQEVDTQAALVKQLEGSLAADKANEGAARINLGYARIVAPISGRIGLKAVDIGNVVNQGDANGIATITRTEPIDVQFSLPQDQVPEIMARMRERAELPVTAYDRTRATVLESGKFSTLDNQVDTQTGTIRAKARFANAKSTLFPNQFVNVRLLLRTIQDGVMVPVTALRHGATGDFVYVLNQQDRTVALRPVVRGQATVDKIEIRSGLKVGETVITEGGDRLKDGAKVTLPGDKPAAGGAGGARGDGQRRRGADAASASAAAEPLTDAERAARRERRRAAGAAQGSAPAAAP